MAKKKRQRIFETTQTGDSLRFWQEATIEAVGDEPTGKEWEVTIIGPKSTQDLVTVEGEKFLRSKNGRLYALSALEQSAPLWEGVKVYDNHLTQEEFERKQGMRSVDGEWLGSIVSPFWDAATSSVKGVFKVVEESLGAKLKSAWEQGILNTIGLSIDTFPIVSRQAQIEGKRMPIIEGFEKILSVDLVAEPAAGGSLDRIMAAAQHNSESPGGLTMDKEQLAELISQSVGAAIEPLGARLDKLEAANVPAAEADTSSDIDAADGANDDGDNANASANDDNDTEDEGDTTDAQESGD